MSLRIKRGDKVVVLSGKDKEKSGRILKVLPKDRVIVEGVNLVKKHMKKRSEGDAGGIKSIPSSLHISSVALLCPNCNKGVRFEVKVLEDKSKVRICKKCKRKI